MSFTVKCQNCGKNLRASDEHIGKKAKCSGCGIVVVIQKPHAATVPATESENEAFYFREPESTPQKPRSPVDVVSKPSPVKTRKQFSAIVLVGVGTTCLIVGYFVGREHLKFQWSSALRDFGKSWSSGFADGLRGASEKPDSAPDPLTAIAMGQPYRRDEFELTLDSASIGKVPLNGFVSDGQTTSSEPFLMLGFTLNNPHDRKILSVSLNNRFIQRFRLVDDVDNLIRGVSFSIGDTVIGAIESSDDIAPGKSRTHVEVFSVPPPNTQFLLLTTDCEAFGSDGKVVFRIPAASIAGL